MFDVLLPPAAHVGAGSLKRLEGLLPAGGRVLVALDRAVAGTPAIVEALAALDAGGRTLVVTDLIPPEPTDRDIDTLVAGLKAEAFDVVVGIGGGSVLDGAKLLAAMLIADTTAAALADGAAIARRLPLILVPTTAGTGSEATPNAIVAFPERNLKIGIVRPALMPDHVILDPTLTLTLPPAVTAATGIDALCHAVECHTASVANPLSDMVSAEATRLIFANLRRAHGRPDDMAAREAMLLAAFLGGVAIAASGTNIVHALSYPLGGRFRVPHGIANAVLLVAGMRFNADACGAKLARLAETAGIVPPGTAEATAVAAFLDALARLVADLGIPAKLADIGVPATALPDLVEAAFGVKRLLNQNPKPVSRDDIRAIYEELL
jgi:alcohol dehydrogenase class IV